MKKKGSLGIKSMPVILLTGCINPMGMTFTKLQNPEVRRLQYIEAIKFYLRNTVHDIVFVENSGVDISSEFENDKDRERMEFLSFLGNDYKKELGKGYGEMLILMYALEHSVSIKKTPSLCKITGRYKILNIKSILQSYMESECDMMVDLPKQLRYGDSRIFIAGKDFFTNFLFKTIDMINDSEGFYFEHALNRSVLEAIIEKRSYLPLKYKARFMGQSGTDGLYYDHSFFTWLRKNIRQMINFKLFLRGLDN